MELPFTIPERPDPGADFSALNDALEAWARLGSSSSLVSVVSTYTASSPASVLMSAPIPENVANPGVDDALARAISAVQESQERKEGG